MPLKKPAKGNAASKKTSENFAFTVDFDSDNSSLLGEMPSITKLLNRKKLGRITPSAPPRPNLSRLPSDPSALPFAPVVQEAEAEAENEDTLSEIQPLTPPPAPPRRLQKAATFAAVPPPAPTPAPHAQSHTQAPARVTPALRRSSINPTQSLAHWETSRLQTSTDPFSKTLAQLLANGAHSCLFFSLVPPSRGLLPQFVATAWAGERDRSKIWKGSQWNPVLTPSIWSRFMKSGWVELPLIGAISQGDEVAILRAAFGCQTGEWGLLLRAGTAEACKGLVVLFSQQSLSQLVPAIIRALSPSRNSKAAA